MGQIFKITKETQQFTIQKAKVVGGNFGTQLWCGVVNNAGEEGAVYLPWVNKDGSVGGGARQLIQAGLMGPEDYSDVEDTWIDALQGAQIATERVFKDGSQYINVRAVKASGLTPVQAAAVKELDLQRTGDEQQFAQSLGVTAPSPQPVAPQRKAKESANDRIKRAFDYVMEHYAERFAEMDQDLVRNIVAFTATHAIAYEKEG